MTTSSERVVHASDEPTTSLPGFIDMGGVLPELSTPQERYDHGFKRGYLAGYAEGARQAQSERAADLANQKATWAANLARAGALVSQLASATDEYIARFGARDGALTEDLIDAAFALAEAVVGSELRTRPDRGREVARSILANLPTGPAVIRVNPGDEPLMQDAVSGFGNSRNGVTVIADPNVGPGGCIVTCAAKTVDARIEEALSRARQAFCAPTEQPDGSVSDAGGNGYERATRYSSETAL